MDSSAKRRVIPEMIFNNGTPLLTKPGYNHPIVQPLLPWKKLKVRQPPFLFWVLYWTPSRSKLGYLRKNSKNFSQWVSRTSATKREILSLVGSLQHATKIVHCGRAFVSRMYRTAAKLRELHFYT